MKRCETIQEVMEYILRNHRALKSGSGFHGYKFFRKADGSRIPFESVDGFRIFNFECDKTSLRVDQMASGFEYRGKQRVQQSSRLWLTDLVMINVYSHSAEFFSQSSIDFSYIEKTFDSEIELLSEWTRNVVPVLRAQWVAKDNDIDRILDDLALGRKIKTAEHRVRFIDMDDDL